MAPFTSTWLLRQLLDPVDSFDKLQAASPKLRRFVSFDRLKFPSRQSRQARHRYFNVRGHGRSGFVVLVVVFYLPNVPLQRPASVL